MHAKEKGKIHCWCLRKGKNHVLWGKKKPKQQQTAKTDKNVVKHEREVRKSG